MRKHLVFLWAAALIVMAGCMLPGGLFDTKATQTSTGAAQETAKAAFQGTFKQSDPVPLNKVDVTNSGPGKIEVTIPAPIAALVSPPSAPSKVQIVGGSIGGGDQFPTRRTEITQGASANASTEEENTLSSAWYKVMPLWIKILGFAIGLLVLVFVLKYAWGFLKDTSIGATFQLGDAALKAEILKLKERMQETTDKAKMDDLNSQVVALEARRDALLAETNKTLSVKATV